MKKALVILLALAVVGGLFAQDAPTFTIQGRVDGWWTPFQAVTRDVPKRVWDPGTSAWIDDPSGATESVTLLGAGLGRDANNGNGVRGRIFIEGRTDIVGLKLQLQFYPFIQGNNYNPGNDGIGNTPQYIGFDDNVMVWWKPIPEIELDVGKFVNDPLRGKIGNNWMKAYTVSAYDEDEIFSRFRSQGFGTSASNIGVLGLFKFGDLTAGILFPQLDPFTSAQASGAGGGKGATYETVVYNSGANEFVHVYERTQIGVGYNIQDIGLARVQFIGANKGFTIPSTVIGQIAANTPRIELAFQLTAVQGLTLDIGGKIPFPVVAKDIKGWTRWEDDPATLTSSAKYEWKAGSGDAKVQNPYQVSLGARFQLDALDISGRVDGKFGGSAEKLNAVLDKVYKFGPELNVHLWPGYNLGFAKAYLDIGLGWVGESKYDGEVIKKSDGFRVGFGAYLEKPIGACTIRGGLAYRVASEFAGVKEDGVFSIPVMFDYTF